jgi:hypothetical protein
MVVACPARFKALLTRLQSDGMITRTYGHQRHGRGEAFGSIQHTGGIELPVAFDELASGHEFSPVRYCLDAETVSAYVEAVGAHPRSHVPPLAVAARGIASLGELIALPAGTIHASQEFEFYRLVPVGARVVCVATVTRKLSRGAMRMLTLEMNISDESGAPVQKGRSTIVLPEA